MFLISKVKTDLKLSITVSYEQKYAFIFSKCFSYTLAQELVQNTDFGVPAPGNQNQWVWAGREQKSAFLISTLVFLIQVV